MKTIYTEKIHEATRFGLIDEDGRKTPCGTLWSDAQRDTFKRLLNGGNNLDFMVWGGDGAKKPHSGRSGRTLGDRKNFASSARLVRMRR